MQDILKYTSLSPQPYCPFTETNYHINHIRNICMVVGVLSIFISFLVQLLKKIIVSFDTGERQLKWSAVGVPFRGQPFHVLGEARLYCHHGPDRHIKEKQAYMEKKAKAANTVRKNYGNLCFPAIFKNKPIDRKKQREGIF